jgi:hypothetical protein
VTVIVPLDGRETVCEEGVIVRLNVGALTVKVAVNECCTVPLVPVIGIA